MSKQHITSILHPIVIEVDAKLKNNESLLEIKKYVCTEVQKHTRMNPIDLQTIIRETNLAPTGPKLQQYLWNSLLKFEGDGVWQKQN